ncbi:MAG: hypothetical protein ACI396_00220 [Acutalibacteraceae bacterium]
MQTICNKLFKKAVTVVSFLAILSNLFGCAKSPDNAKHHKPSDLTVISMSCCHMDFSYGYMFTLSKESGSWCFSAQCFTNDHEQQTEFENQTVSDEDIAEMLEIIKQNGTIEYAQNFKKTIKLPFEVLDQTSYSLYIKFSDGIAYNVDSTSRPDGALESYFYRLAEKLTA